MSLEAIKFDRARRTLAVLDQLKLPHETVYVRIENTQDAHDAIKRMVVRGAPAIAIVGIIGVALDVASADSSDLKAYARSELDYIVTSRPTAVNLSKAATEVKETVVAPARSDAELKEALLDWADRMLKEDIASNRSIGRHGLYWVNKDVSPPTEDKISVITICNTGSLATAGYGTALGVIRSLHEAGRLERVYALETRPYNQGARLTAYELVHDKIPATLVTDSMAASLMRSDPTIKLVVAGADRVAANGDTANKIGTYQLAVLAKHHAIKFAIAAPLTSIDNATATGSDIKIEERPENELTHINGVAIAAPGIGVWNPAFDVTPRELIDAIITDDGVRSLR